MKILIAGGGKIGSILVRQLSQEGYDITLIDTEEALLGSIVERYDVITVQGNAATMTTLKQAGVEEADLLIAVTGADEINLLSCLTAHTINPKLHTIARISNPEYTRQAYAMRENFGLSLIINPERSAAVEVERLLRYPGFLKHDTFAKGRVDIVELKIGQESKLKDMPLTELRNIVRSRVLVVAVLRDGEIIVAPSGDHVLREGDKIYVTASRENLSALLRNVGIVKKKSKHVMIVGGSKIGYYLSEILIRDGISVEIIDNDPQRCLDLADMIPDATIVQGDASIPDFLENEGLSETDAFITLTGLDELNILLSLYGNSHGVSQVITKLSRVEYSKTVENLPLGSVLSPKELCCSNIVRYVRAIRNQKGAAITVHQIADGRAEAVEFLVDEETKHVGEPLKDVRTKKNLLIGGISRAGRSEIPDGSSSFNIGDSVVVICDGKTVLYSLNDIFED